MNILVWIIVIWIVGSILYGFISGKVDSAPFIHQYKIWLTEHPIITIVVTVGIIIVIKNALS